MVKNVKVNGKQTEQEQRTLEQLSVAELKVLAFDLQEQGKHIQRQYNAVYETLVAKSQPTKEDE